MYVGIRPAKSRTAAETRDYPTLLALTLVVAIFTVIGNLLADIGYGVIDRRVRVS